MTSALPTPLRSLLDRAAETDSTLWWIGGAALVFGAFVCGVHRSNSRERATAFAALDELLPEPLRERPAPPWLWLGLAPLWALASWVLIELEPTVTVDGVGTGKLIHGLFVAAAVALAASGIRELRRSLRAARAWRTAGRVRLAPRPSSECQIGESNLPTLFPAARRRDSRGWAVWTLAGLMSAVYLPVTVIAVREGEWGAAGLAWPLFLLPQAAA